VRLKLSTFLICPSLHIITGNTCIQRSVGPDAIVCVCNSTYCDTLDELPLQANQFQLYTSTISGERLQLTTGNFFNDSLETSNETRFTVDPNQKHQEIFGFGGALTDAAALNIRTLSNATQQKLLEYYNIIDFVK